MKGAATFWCLVLVACTADPTPQSDAVGGSEPAMPADDASDDAGVPTPTAERPAPAATMPERIRGSWREDDLGRAPTAEDCDQTSSTNRNFGKVLTVRADGFSLFESGGRIIEVHARTPDMIDATFDTTYADTPTQGRFDFAVQPDGTLAVNYDDGDGRLSVTQYRRCPVG